MRIYRLLDPRFERTAALYRIRIDDEGLFIERFDPRAGAWTEGPSSFLRFVVDGELGAEEISAGEADRMMAAGLPALPRAASPAGP